MVRCERSILNLNAPCAREDYVNPNRRKLTLLCRILQFNQRVTRFIYENYQLIRRIKYKLRTFTT